MGGAYEPLEEVPFQLPELTKEESLRQLTDAEKKVAAHEISQMDQKALQLRFRIIYGKSTSSNNNAWLRRKLMEAAGLKPPPSARARGRPIVHFIRYRWVSAAEAKAIADQHPQAFASSRSRSASKQKQKKRAQTGAGSGNSRPRPRTHSVPAIDTKPRALSSAEENSLEGEMTEETAANTTEEVIAGQKRKKKRTLSLDDSLYEFGNNWSTAAVAKRPRTSKSAGKKPPQQGKPSVANQNKGASSKNSSPRVNKAAPARPSNRSGSALATGNATALGHDSVIRGFGALHDGNLLGPALGASAVHAFGNLSGAAQVTFGFSPEDILKYQASSSSLPHVDRRDDAPNACNRTPIRVPSYRLVKEPQAIRMAHDKDFAESMRVGAGPLPSNSLSLAMNDHTQQSFDLPSAAGANIAEQDDHELFVLPASYISAHSHPIVTAFDDKEFSEEEIHQSDFASCSKQAVPLDVPISMTMESMDNIQMSNPLNAGAARATTNNDSNMSIISNGKVPSTLSSPFLDPCGQALPLPVTSTLPMATTGLTSDTLFVDGIKLSTF